MEPLHPAPTPKYKADHRETENREQLAIPSEYASIWKRTVENLAAELQIEPMEAHFLLMDSGWFVTKGQAWEWWT